MSSDFSGSITFKGTTEECLNFLEVIKDVQINQYNIYQQYKKSGNYEYNTIAWFISALDDNVLSSRQNMLSYIKKHKCNIQLDFSGPWGFFQLLETDIDLFERIADAAPDSTFYGRIVGDDPGAEMGIKASLENGIMHRWSYYIDYFENDYDNDDEDINYDDYWEEDCQYIPLSENLKAKILSIMEPEKKYWAKDFESNIDKLNGLSSDIINHCILSRMEKMNLIKKDGRKWMLTNKG